MRVAAVLSAAVALLLGAMGCKGPKVDPAAQTTRMTQYKRLAIVCVPGQGADPAFAEQILNSAKPSIPSRLGFLTACDCLTGVPTDVTAVPPRVNLAARAASPTSTQPSPMSLVPPSANLAASAADYDAVLCLVYEYGMGSVVLHMYLLDARTGAQAWYHKLSTKDPDIAGRLRRHGFWVPAILKQRCYGVK